MKKSILSLMSLMLFGFLAQGQTVNGTVSGKVVNSAQQPVPGIAVFGYGADMDPSSKISYRKKDFLNKTYTDAQGNYTLFYSANNLDTVGISVLDCQLDAQYLTYVAYTPTPNGTNMDFQINTCVPNICTPFLKADTFASATGSSVVYEAVALRDSAQSQQIIQGNILHEWTFSDNYNTSNHVYRPGNPNHDTIVRNFNGAVPRHLGVCYRRSAGCGTGCLGTSNPRSCQAAFYVDTVNSINFQGQVVIWENSDVDTIFNTIGYRWDFGDGNFSNVRYPIHTYSDTGIYNVCLTIVSVDGSDTCVSTYCDSIGFDANGNLIYKTTQQGFTINVIDPSTIGQKEEVLPSAFNLYPNPSLGEAALSWDASLSVQQVNVLGTNGQLLRSVQPASNLIEFKNLSSGVYIVQIQSAHGTVAKRMIVR